MKDLDAERIEGRRARPKNPHASPKPRANEFVKAAPTGDKHDKGP